MKKIIFLLSFTIGFACMSFAQTKKIAHRSHSGIGKNFTSNDDDNYGNPPIHYKEKKDSLLKKVEQQKVDSAAKAKTNKPIFVKPKKNKNKQNG